MSDVLSPFLSSVLLRYYFGPDHPAKIRFFRWLHAKLGKARFNVPFGTGARISLEIDDYFQFQFMKTRRMDGVWEALAAQATENEIVWDVGANIGTISLAAAQDPRVRETHCFEPNPSTFQALQTNFRLNPKLALSGHCFALSDTTAEREFHLGLRNNTGVASFYGHWNTKTVTVSCFTGDECIAKGWALAPTLLKLDVEGAELEVLKGLENTLRTSPPKAIVFEAHHSPENLAAASRVLLNHLSERGYESKILAGEEDGRPTVNYLALRRAKD